jgi:hypothetical protein
MWYCNSRRLHCWRYYLRTRKSEAVHASQTRRSFVYIFQCPNRQSQNIWGKDLLPDTNVADACFESLCIRAQLDAFWARSRIRLRITCQVPRSWQMAKYGRTLGFTPMPPLGPFCLGQHNGMMQAIMPEMRSMEPGKKENSKLQFGTARKLRATTTVRWEASPGSGTDIVMSAGNLKGRYIATLCPSESRW